MNLTRAHTLVHICTWDRERLFSKICGSLTAAGLNILSGQIFSRADGIILDTFIVTDAMTGGLANKEERERFEEVLTKVLGSEADLGSIIGKLKSKPGLYQPVDGDEIATQVHFDNDAALKRTVLDVETEDRIGLLYILSQTLAELGLDLALAKISTEKGAAMDTFYVRNRDGTKIEIPAQQQKVAERIKSAVAKLDRKR